MLTYAAMDVEKKAVLLELVDAVVQTGPILLYMCPHTAV
jgi:hypothetical protein